MPVPDKCERKPKDEAENHLRYLPYDYLEREGHDDWKEERYAQHDDIAERELHEHVCVHIRYVIR